VAHGWRDITVANFTVPERTDDSARLANKLDRILEMMVQISDREASARADAQEAARADRNLRYINRKITTSH